MPKKKVSRGTLHPRREPLLRSAAMTDSGTPSAAAQRRDWSSSLIPKGFAMARRYHAASAAAGTVDG